MRYFVGGLEGLLALGFLAAAVQQLFGLKGGIDAVGIVTVCAAVAIGLALGKMAIANFRPKPAA